MYDVPNREDEEQKVKILYAEAALDPDYSLKGGEGYFNGDTDCQSGIYLQMKNVLDCLKVTTPWLML